ncbi:MAG: hypothetical protein ACOCTR_06400 [Candidatus Natronoplasma sp.]
MTEDVKEKLDEHKYNILYYIYFITCLLVAVWIADPINVLGALI